MRRASEPSPAASRPSGTPLAIVLPPVSNLATARLSDVDVSAIERSLAAFYVAQHDPVETAQPLHQCIEIRLAQRMSVEQARGNIRVGGLDQALHDANLDHRHGLDGPLGEPSEQEVQL